ncbi:methyltransferase-like protein 7B [Camellia sinensis]|nr:methyltransferase-like protein 7B [Camellia sinensis]
MTLKEVMRVLKPGGLFLFVEHVAAKDGTILRFVQGILDPLQQRVSDGCHLTRKTGEYISEAGFSDVDVNMAFVSVASILGPHVYGIACK